MLGLERPAVPQGCVSVLSLQAWPACHVPAVRREQRGPPRPESVPWTHKAVGPEWPWEVALCGRRPAEWPGQGRRVGQISSLHSCYCDLPAAPFPLILLPSSEATLGGGACAVCSARASASCRPAPGRLVAPSRLAWTLLSAAPREPWGGGRGTPLGPVSQAS